MRKASNHSALGTVVYGLFIIVPAAIIFLLLVKLTEILEKVAAPLGIESSFGAAIALVVATVAALAVIMMLSWIIGSIMRRVVSYEKFESTVLNEIPGYQIIANIARGFAEGETSYVPALVDIHGTGAAAMGFIMEEHTSGKVSVYIPSVPVLTVGSIYIVSPEHVTRLTASAKEVADCISKWGAGSESILNSAVPVAEPAVDK